MTRKKILIFFVSFLGLIALAILGWSIYKKGFLRSKVKDAVAGGSAGLYSISFGKLDMDEVNGNLSVSGLSLRPDTVRYNQLAQAGNAPAILARLDIPSLTVAGVKTPKALLNK
jgi:hypothetical protein